MDGHVIATAPWYLSNTNSQHLKPGGRFISSVDMDERANVCVIGSDVVRKVFPAENPLGKALKVGSGYYIVVGMMQADTSTKQDSKSAGDVATDINSSVIIPLETAKERLGTMTGEQTAGSISFETVELHQIIVKVNDINQVLPVSQVVQGLIKKYHSKQDYEMVVPLELLKEIEKNARMFTLVLGMIAAISLLVGGIGIMNIMLASVTERTREIGIRRALGAKKRDIVVQFLSETVVLSLFGGVLGLGVGILIPVIIRSITGMHVIFTAWSLILSFSISAVVGLVFGIYPAYRAANMDPIEALRHE
jgi:putative ABC transport system permease protein